MIHAQSDCQRLLREGFAALAAGQAMAAEALASQALLQIAEHPHALLLQALALSALQRHQAALPLFQRLVELAPQVAEHWMNLAAALQRQGDAEAALQALLRAESLGAAHPEFLLELAERLLDAGSVQAARQRLQRLQARAALPPAGAVLMARAAIDGGQLVEAREWMLQAEPALGDDPLALSDAGSLWLQVGDAARAEALLTRALKLAPRHPEVLARQLLLLERTNRLAEAEQWVQQCSDLRSPELDQARAKLLARNKQTAAAIAAFRALQAASTLPAQRCRFAFELGKLHDQAGDAAAAIAALAQAHQDREQAIRADRGSAVDQGQGVLKLTAFPSDPQDVARWTPPGPSDEVTAVWPDPVFVVGFPRSGTTLLEQMLDAHPALQSMDEQPFLQRAIDRVLQAGVAYPEQLAALDAANLQAIRAAYFADVAQVVDLAPGQRLVDKNPLNLLRLAMIRRLFPQAQVILALRHPCDVVLSCHMQMFRAPGFALLCRSLRSTAEGYQQMMAYFLAEQQRLPGEVLEWRYEDLLDDSARQTRRLLQFLDLAPVEGLHDVAARARQRGYISTPSYSQVIEPLNRRALGRWQRYRPWLEPTFDLLRPLAERWGYSLAE